MSDQPFPIGNASHPAPFTSANVAGDFVSVFQMEDGTVVVDITEAHALAHGLRVVLNSRDIWKDGSNVLHGWTQPRPVDYKAIVDENAQLLGARVLDIRSSEVLEDFDYMMQMMQSALAGLPPVFSAFSDVEAKTLIVDVEATKTELGAFIALHELGHIATTPPHTPTGDPELEARATAWALDHFGLRPSPETAEQALKALKTYTVDRPAGPLTREVETELHGLMRQ